MRTFLALTLAATFPTVSLAAPDDNPQQPAIESHRQATGDATTSPPTDLSAAMSELIADWNANLVIQRHINTEMQTLAAHIQALPPTAPTTPTPKPTP